MGSQVRPNKLKKTGGHVTNQVNANVLSEKKPTGK